MGPGRAAAGAAAAAVGDVARVRWAGAGLLPAARALGADGQLVFLAPAVPVGTGAAAWPRGDDDGADSAKATAWRGVVAALRGVAPRGVRGGVRGGVRVAEAAETADLGVACPAPLPAVLPDPAVPDGDARATRPAGEVVALPGAATP